MNTTISTTIKAALPDAAPDRSTTLAQLDRLLGNQQPLPPAEAVTLAVTLSEQAQHISLSEQQWHKLACQLLSHGGATAAYIVNEMLNQTEQGRAAKSLKVYDPVMRHNSTLEIMLVKMQTNSVPYIEKWQSPMNLAPHTHERKGDTAKLPGRG